MNEKWAEETPYNLDRIRDLISRVQQSIVEDETQSSPIEWFRWYFALYLSRKSKSIAASIEDFTDYQASGFQENQSINVYGVIEGRYEYINTCDISELEVALKCLPTDWWESFAIELINEPGRMIHIAELAKQENNFLQLLELPKDRIR